MHGIGNDWDGMLAAEFEKEYYGKLLAFWRKNMKRTASIRRSRMFSMRSAILPMRTRKW